MEPVTHALASLAMASAGLDRVTRLAAPMLLVSGLAADLDWVSYAGGARVFLAVHRTATHSLLGTAIIAVVTAAAFVMLSRRIGPEPKLPARTAARPSRIRFSRALGVCAAGATIHLLLDLTNSYGVKLLWPFQQKWYGWDLDTRVDPLLLVLLAAALLLPVLFRLVTEEISGTVTRGGKAATLALLAVIFVYFGARAVWHLRALELVSSRLYAGERPLRAASSPDVSPLKWRGVVETPAAMDEVPVSLWPGDVFNPENARTYFKPDESPALEAARQSDSGKAFLAFARFPLATLESTPFGGRIRIRDLRFDSPGGEYGTVIAVIDVNSDSKVVRDVLEYETNSRSTKSESQGSAALSSRAAVTSLP